MGFNDRESKRKSIVADMISNKEEKEKSKNLKQKSYYLTDELIKALALESALSGKDKSMIIREALEERLKERLKQVSDE